MATRTRETDPAPETRGRTSTDADGERATTRRRFGFTRGRRTARDPAVARQRDEFGGFYLGAAFFGWLVAAGLATILVALIAAAGTAIGLTEGTGLQGSAETIGVVGAAVLIAILGLAYFAGGYVAGRLSRFDGGRQGFGAWLIGLIVTLALAGAGYAFGDQYNVFAQLNLPRIPVDEGDLTTGAAITLAAILIITLALSVAGGKVGERFHRRVDSASYDEDVADERSAYRGRGDPDGRARTA